MAPHWEGTENDVDRNRGERVWYRQHEVLIDEKGRVALWRRMDVEMCGARRR